jgi:hypothetical protein
MSPPAVAILIPVLGRPHRVVPTIESVTAATPEAHRLLFLASDTDEATIAALEAAGADHLVVPAARGSWACKINDGYRATTEPWIFAAADDLAFHPGWFSRALAWASERTGVIGTNDICNPRVMQGQHSTHSLFRRAYVDELGTIDEAGLVLHERYGHDYADDEAIATAMARGVYVHAFDSIVEHLHPMVGKAADDDTYRLGRTHARPGQRLFLQRRRLWANPKAAAAPPPAPVAPVVVVTASYGGTDAVLHPQAAQDIAVDWVCFTDQPDLKAPAPWRVVHSPARFADPCLAAKVHKATPAVDATDVVWIDASMEVTSRSFVRSALAARHDGVAVFTHPRRSCIYDEAEASLGAEGQGGKYADQPLLAQVAAYRAEGHPAQGGLYACGVVAWDLTNPRAVDLGRAWLAECEQWSWQDQLSFPVVCRRLGVTPGVFPIQQIERNGRGFLTNRWLRIWPHTAPSSPAPAARKSASTFMTIDPEQDGVSVVIPYTSDDPARQAARRYVLGWYAARHPGWEIIEGDCPGDWSKGAALADAVARASHDVLVVADADSVVPADVLAQAVRVIAAGARWVMPHRTVFRLAEEHTAAVYAGAEPQRSDTCRAPYTGVTGGGITVLTRGTWQAVGGIDPRFVGWGGEDMAFGWALETLCGPGVHLAGPLFHLWHKHEAKGDRRRGCPQSEALAGRYRVARNKPDAMRALIAEHAGVVV